MGKEEHWNGVKEQRGDTMRWYEERRKRYHGGGKGE